MADLLEYTRNFRNEPLVDFSIEANRNAFAAALTLLDARIVSGELSAIPLIDGRATKGGTVVTREDPAAPDIALGKVAFATAAEAAQAVDSLAKAAGAWSRTDVDTRARMLERAADLMAQRRFQLAALIVREAGKPWRESDADVAEAIDFCRYYAGCARQLDRIHPTSIVAGEDNFYSYQGRGVAVVIAPWNFPLAIACGMTVAALVTGNATALKPAEQTSIIAHEFAKILLEAGVPGSVFAFLPGVGEEVGRLLVEHPRTDLVCFTGSKSVGLQIIRSAAAVQEGQRNIKRVVAELGGKNAVIVDEDADLDEAVKGILHSAFAFAGQKCSACSRVIVVGDAYEPFLARFRDAAGDIISGSPVDPASFLCPVIDKEAHTRILGTIDQARATEKVLLETNVPERGYFAPITIFRDVRPASSLWRNEIFGPVVACCRAATFKEAIAAALDSEYALTGGVYSRSPAHIAEARREFRVGNLYINRTCTGALVGRQPFGGFGMSGVGSKAGGPDYLLQFMEPRSVSENTMRRGFAPEIPLGAA